MIRSCSIRALLSLAFVLLASCGTATPTPRLVVVIAVDQMRADYLDVFAGDYNGGFARLREQSAIFVDGHQDHALTSTSPGHATISTGAFPSRHGLVANEFFDRRAGRVVGAVADPVTRLVGANGISGSSPARLERDGLGDWLKTQSPDSKVASVSLKDRSAILMGGRAADAAFWLDLGTGHFVTSDYYREDLPEWAADFNATGAVKQYNGSTWTELMPDPVYENPPWPELAGWNASRYSQFPRAIGVAGEPPGRSYYFRFRGSPFADRETLDFAESLVENEEFGTDDSPDVLFIGLSATDYIGHRVGPYAREIHDQFIRLDGYLGNFFAYLDERIGADSYVVALSADHGALPVPEQLADIGIDAGRVHPDDLLAFIEPVVEAALVERKIPSRPELAYAGGPALIFTELQPTAEQRAALQRAVAARLLEHPAVAAAYTYEDQLAGDVDDANWAESYRRSFHPERAPDVTVRLRENYILRESATGTSHGSPYRYDTHVPIVFLGSGIAAGRHTQRVMTADIAPTLASILGITAPEDLDGRDLSGIVQAQ